MVEEYNIPNCNSNECEAHKYVMGMINELKDWRTIKEGDCQDIKLNIAVLTQNVIAVQKVSEELKIHSEKQDTLIQDNNKFVIKFGAIIGAITFIAAVSPLLLMLIKLLKG